MKTLKSILLGIAVMAIAIVANAKSINGKLPFSSDYVLKTYIAATTQGNLAGYEKVLNNDATFSIVQGKRTLSLSKEQMLESLKASEGISQVCTVSTKIVGEDIDKTVYEVDTKFADYTNVNLVTLVGNNLDGWKIASVETTMKSN
jgi:hypothetical protein